jgi:hypothetical protein
MRDTDNISVYAAEVLIAHQLIEENPEPHICRFFGCGKELKPVENMAGDYCASHMVRNPIDPINVIKF